MNRILSAIGGAENDVSQTDEEPRENIDEPDNLQHKAVNREHRRANQILLREIALGHEEGVPALLVDDPNVFVIRLAAKFCFLVLNLRADVFGQYCDDVFPLRLGQPESYGMQIAINEFHSEPFYKIWFSALLMLPHSASSCLRICLPSGERR